MSDTKIIVVTTPNTLAGSKALQTDSSGNLQESAVTSTELGYVSGVTSAIQTQLNAKQPSGNYVTALTGDVTASGPGSVAATVAQVGGSSASAVHSAEQTVNTAQSGNKFLASPFDGTSGTPSMRAIVAADIPTLNQNTTGTAAGLSSTLAIGSGGTGQTSANAALNALLPNQTGNTGKVLSTDGSNTSWTTPLTNPMDAALEMIYGGSAGVVTKTNAGTAGQVPIVNSGATAVAMASLPGNSNALKAPAITRLVSTGTQAGIVFTVTAANATVGATYTNNGHTFTVLQTISGGTTLYTSGVSAPTASGTLTKASGTGDATITFSAEATLATWTPQSSPNALYAEIELVSGGGGGGGNGSGASNGNNGTQTHFINDTQGIIVTAGAGNGGLLGAAGAAGGSGNSGFVTTNVTVIRQQAGTNGGASGNSAGNGPDGGSTPYAGQGLGGRGNTTTGNTGGAAADNTGSGGGGSGPDAGSTSPGSGGGAGAYIKFQITNLSTGTFYYTIGSGGSGGSGTSIGGAGGSGGLQIRELYQ